MVLRDLGQYDAALRHAERAVVLREEGRVRSLALCRITLADIHVHRNDLDAALHAGRHLLTADPALASVRVVHQLHDLRRLLETRRAHRPVREYLEHFDEARRTRMLLLADIITPSRGGTL